MAYAFTQDVPIDAAFYRRVINALGDEPSKGFIAHIAVERPEGGLRYIEVWETEQDWDNFAEERLHPVLHTLLSEVFGDKFPPEPERTPLSVVDVWLQGGVRH
jgi:hypothetical protein